MCSGAQGISCKETHQGHFAGHLAAKKVYDRLRRLVWWREE